MARKLIMNDADAKRTWQMNGLIILLISKAAGIPIQSPSLQSSSTSLVSNENNNSQLSETKRRGANEQQLETIVDGIHESQRCLAEIAEMIYMGSMIHKGVIDLKHGSENGSKLDMDQGNKLAVLCGDFLLANACTNLSKLHNNKVVEMMSQVISDISQSMFECNYYYEQSKFSFLNRWYDRLNR